MSTKPAHKTRFIVVTGEPGLRKSEVVRTLVKEFKDRLISPKIYTTGVANGDDLVHVEEEEFKALESTMIVRDDISGTRYGVTTEIFLLSHGKMPVLRLRPQVARSFQEREGRGHVHVISVGKHGIAGVIRHAEELFTTLSYD